MLFNSYAFLFAFFPFTLCGYYLLRRLERVRTAQVFLLAASWFFYAWWDPRYLGLIVAWTFADYVIAARILSARARGEGSRGWLVGGLAFNLGLLGYFKYFGFLVRNINGVFHAGLAVPAIVLPLAISFHTFQQIAYLVDAHRGEVQGRPPLLDYALFVCFFPQLIAGPIVHHTEFFPQLAKRGYPDSLAVRLSTGLTVLAIGLVKKVIFADAMAGYATPLFDAADAGVGPCALEAWGGSIAYAFQIYFDFSGYSDMAIGLAACFGFAFPFNFASPYKSRSITEFWRRWHMTLSRFLRDYLYISLGGNRKGATRRHVNLMITMLLGGLWHGAGWTFVVWGALHGGYLVVNHRFRDVARARGWELERTFVGRAACTMVTMLAVVVAWVFFRSKTVSGALVLLRAMAGAGGAPTEGLDRFFIPWLIGCGLVVWVLPNTQEWMGLRAPNAPSETPSSEVRMPAWRPSTLWGVAVGALVVLGVMGLGHPTVFIYFHF